MEVSTVVAGLVKNVAGLVKNAFFVAAALALGPWWP
jgi:hypothetical protein